MMENDVFFFQAEDGIRDIGVTGVQTCALPISRTGAPNASGMSHGTLEAMARGGTYDQLGGGFARYSVDRDWVVPHFEKMLYDNALLCRVYAHLWRATGSELARRVAVETADFMVRELRSEEHTSELQSRQYLVCRLLLEKK